MPAKCVLCPVGKPDMVYGCTDYQSCDVVRRHGGSCGPNANMYIEKKL